MPALYQLVDQLKGLQAAIEDLPDDAPADLFKDTFEALEGDIQKKCEDWSVYLKLVSLEYDNCKSEIKRLQKLKSQLENQLQKGKDTVKHYMQEADVRSVKGTAPMYLRKGQEHAKPQSDDVEPPAQFVTVEQVKKVDGRGITAAMKEGAEFTGYALVRGDDSLVLK